MTGPAGDRLREALLRHHPIMRSETGPFSGCRCGQVGLGQDVIEHVVTELREALAADTEQRARERAAEELEEVLALSTQRGPLETIAWAARRHAALLADDRTGQR